MFLLSSWVYQNLWFLDFLSLVVFTASEYRKENRFVLSSFAFSPQYCYTAEHNCSGGNYGVKVNE